MELIIVAAAAVGILALIALLSPGVERGRQPVQAMVGRDQHTRRIERASLAAQVAQRRAPRPLRVSGDAIRPIETPVTAPPARAAAQNQRERNADGLVASLLEPAARAS